MSKQAIFTLYEKHYHYGVAALINSALAAGFTGRLLISSQVYTSRGIGMVGLPFRFNCRPEVTEITFCQTSERPLLPFSNESYSLSVTSPQHTKENRSDRIRLDTMPCSFRKDLYGCKT
jgi:hypothetical protein